MLIDAGAPPERVVVTGCPRVGLQAWTRDRARHALGLDDRPVILVATNNLLGDSDRLLLARVALESVAALGERVRQWVTLHGVSLNVSPDMEHFSLIIPCGIREHGVVSLSGLLGCPVETSLVRERVRASFEQVFQVQLHDTNRDALGV